MKLHILDKSNVALTGAKYWALIAAITGGLLSFGAEYPDYTPVGLYEAYQAKQECATDA